MHGEAALDKECIVHVSFRAVFQSAVIIKIERARPKTQKSGGKLTSCLQMSDFRQEAFGYSRRNIVPSLASSHLTRCIASVAWA